MNTFDRVLYGFRFVPTQRGDTLQRVALRELGDAARWTDLISYNQLVPPFITDDPAVAGAGVLLSGGRLLVPAPVPVADAALSPDEVLGIDVELSTRGELLTADGDFAVVAGPDNLKQAYRLAVEVEPGELMFHPDYGCDARTRLGLVNGPTNALIAARSVRLSLRRDPRTARVVSARASIEGDVLRITAVAESISGRVIQMEV